MLELESQAFILQDYQFSNFSQATGFDKCVPLLLLQVPPVCVLCFVMIFFNICNGLLGQ